MGIFGIGKSEINKVSILIYERIRQLESFIKDGDLDGLCQNLELENIEYQRGNNYPKDVILSIIWIYPELPEFTFQLGGSNFSIAGSADYFGFYLSRSFSDEYFVQAPNKKSIAGYSTTASAKKLKKILVSEHNFLSADKSL